MAPRPAVPVGAGARKAHPPPHPGARVLEDGDVADELVAALAASALGGRLPRRGRGRLAGQALGRKAAVGPALEHQARVAQRQQLGDEGVGQDLPEQGAEPGRRAHRDEGHAPEPVVRAVPIVGRGDGPCGRIAALCSGGGGDGCCGGRCRRV